MSSATMTTMQQVEAMHRRVQQLHHELIQLTTDVRGDKGASLSDPDITDVGFMMREMERLMDDSRKACGSLKMLLGQIIYVRVATAAVNDGVTCLRGKLATATPDVQVKPKIPSVKSPAYANLLRSLGVAEETIRGGFLSLKFQQMSKYLTDLAAQGKNPPEGVGTFNDFTCVFRRVPTEKDHADPFDGDAGEPIADDVGTLGEEEM